MYLSRIPDPATLRMERHPFWKIDICFSCFYLNPQFRVLHSQLEGVDEMHVSHTTDSFTLRAFLFS